MISMRQAMEDGVSEVLSSVVEDVGQAVGRNIGGAQILHELLSAPWLRALLKMYECLLQFQRLSPSPFLPYASGLSLEIMALIQKTHRPSAEARELYSLLRSPHIQALLSSHDSVAQADYGPILPPLPDALPEDEEAMRIVCLVKNNQPLNAQTPNGRERRGSVGDGVGMIRNRWSSLRRITLERLVPARRARSGEELRTSESEAWLLPLPRGRQSHPFLPRYESTGNCCLCPKTSELWKNRLNRSSTSVCSGSLLEEPKPSVEEGTSNGGSSDDYAYPPPPIPAYSLSLPNSPVLYQKGATGGQSRNVPTPNRGSCCNGKSPRAYTAPSSPAAQCSTRDQGVSTLPIPSRQHGCQSGPHNRFQDEPVNRPLMAQYSTAPHHSECQNPPKQTRNKLRQQQPNHCQCVELPKHRSMEELRSTVQAVTSTIEHHTQDVHHLGQKMVAATEMITDSMEENAQALNLLVEVVDKLQGLIVANKHPESSPPHRLKQHTPPPPPQRVLSISPKVVRKTTRSYSRHLLSSSSTSCSSSSSASSVSSCTEVLATPRSPKRMNGGSKRAVVTFGATQRARGSNRHVRLNNGSVLRAPPDDQQDCNNTGCLTTKKKKKNL